MLHHSLYVFGANQLIAADFVNIGLTVGVDDYLIAVFEILYLVEYARGIVRIPDVARQYGIAAPGWEGRTIQPAGVIFQPGNIPFAVLERDAYNRRVDFSRQVFPE